MTDKQISIRRIGQEEAAKLREINTLFGQVFGQPEIYADNPPEDAWLTDLLADAGFVCLVAETTNGDVIASLCGYILKKFEQQRTELFIYDLAVAEAWRRQGVATALIEQLKPIARAAKAWVIFVTADQGDAPATSLYRKLGEEEFTLHYDIQP